MEERTRFLVRVKAYFARHWRGGAGIAWRRLVASAGEQLNRDHEPDIHLAASALGELGAKWLQGHATSEYNEALLREAQAANASLEAELKRRTLAADVRKREAEAEEVTARAAVASAEAIVKRIQASRLYLDFVDEAKRRGIAIDDSLASSGIFVLLKLPGSGSFGSAPELHP